MDQLELFPDSPSRTLCSWNECLSGHRWPPTILGAPCKACTVSVIALKKENCPFCNEPVVRTSLRVDMVPRGGGIATRCTGQEVVGETVDILLERTEWKEVEASYKDFTMKQQEEKVDEKRN